MSKQRKPPGLPVALVEPAAGSLDFREMRPYPFPPIATRK